MQLTAICYSIAILFGFSMLAGLLVSGMASLVSASAADKRGIWNFSVGFLFSFIPFLVFWAFFNEHFPMINEITISRVGASSLVISWICIYLWDFRGPIIVPTSLRPLYLKSKLLWRWATWWPIDDKENFIVTLRGNPKQPWYTNLTISLYFIKESRIILATQVAHKKPPPPRKAIHCFDELGPRFEEIFTNSLIFHGIEHRETCVERPGLKECIINAEKSLFRQIEEKYGLKLAISHTEVKGSTEEFGDFFLMIKAE